MEQERLKSKDDLALRRRLAARLRKGEILMLPTDTVYGLSCLAVESRAIKKIFAIKRRSRHKPLLILVASLAMAKRFCRINSAQAAVLKKIWAQSRPTSVLLRQRELLPTVLNAGSPYLAVRLPKNIFLRRMIREAGVPLVSTSANFSGCEVLDAAGAMMAFKKAPRPDLIVVTDCNKNRRPSRLISLDELGRIRILRK